MSFAMNGFRSSLNETHTALRTKGRYRMLILDGHSSYATTEFDKFCTDKRIIPLYMPPHSSHILQPLDISCFSPLKHIYGRSTTEMMQKGIHSICKDDFLFLYPSAHQRASSSCNIRSGFTATGLIPLNPERALSKLSINLKTPTPPSTACSNKTFGPRKTSADAYQLEQQNQRIQYLKTNEISPSIISQAMDKVIKGAEITMQNAISLQNEVQQLHTVQERKKKKKKKAPQIFIQDGGSLTGLQGQQKMQQTEELFRQESTQIQRKPPKCSNCGQTCHNWLKCPSK